MTNVLYHDNLGCGGGGGWVMGKRGELEKAGWHFPKKCRVISTR
jgi:hypothetical protein